jgi:hypothetical protein
MSPVVPRLQHVLPHGSVTRPAAPLPVVVLITWHDGRQTPEDAAALAWTREEVLVEWTTPWGDSHQVWVHAAHVTRRTGPAPDRDQGAAEPDARA